MIKKVEDVKKATWEDVYTFLEEKFKGMNADEISKLKDKFKGSILDKNDDPSLPKAKSFIKKEYFGSKKNSKELFADFMNK